MKIKTLINYSLSIVIFLLILFSLNMTSCASVAIQNIQKLRVLGDTYYLLDNSQNTLFVGTQKDITENSMKTITTRIEYNDENTSVEKTFKALKDVTILQDGTIFLIDGIADGIFQYDSDTKFTKEHIRSQEETAITKVISLTNGYNNSVYALQYLDGYKILKKSENDDTFSTLYHITTSSLEELNVSLDENALICCDFENQLFYITSLGKLLKIDLTNTLPSVEVVCEYSNTALDISVDYLGNPYVLLSNGQILKYEDGIQYLEINTNTFSLNFENGSIYYIKNNNEVSILDNQFVNNLSKFQHPIDYSTDENLSTGVEIYTTTCNTNIYKYPLKVAQLDKVSSGTKIIKLSNISNYDNYIYALISMNNVLTPCYVLTQDIQVVQSTFINQKMRTFTPSTKLFKYPTADYNSSNENFCLTTLKEITEVQVINNAGNYTDSQGRKFYEILYNNKIYYVMQSMLTTLSTEEGTITLKTPNASVNANENINVYDGLNSDQIITQLSSDVKFYVNLKTYSQKNKRTYIEFLDENNNYITGFIDTKYVKINEMSPYIIIAIFLLLIVAILILLLILYFAKEHKKNKIDKNK